MTSSDKQAGGPEACLWEVYRWYTHEAWSTQGIVVGSKQTGLFYIGDCENASRNVGHGHSNMIIESFVWINGVFRTGF